jgi:hypothetical protein
MLIFLMEVMCVSDDESDILDLFEVLLAACCVSEVFVVPEMCVYRAYVLHCTVHML